MYISRIWGEETPGRIASKFCLPVVIGTQEVITCMKFGDDRLRGFWLAGGQNSPFPIDFAGHPYNSATLPCAYGTPVYTIRMNILGLTMESTYDTPCTLCMFGVEGELYFTSLESKTLHNHSQC